MDGEFQVSRCREAASRPSDAAMVTPMAVLMRFARWDDVLALPEPDANRGGVVAMWRLFRGSALAIKGHIKEAEAEQSAMNEVFSSLPAGRAFGTFFNDWSTLHSIAKESLAARIAAACGNTDTAVDHWRSAVAAQDQMNFDDLPDWYYPVRESLGAALLLGKQAGQAELVFREDLRKNPHNPRSLLGLSRALENTNKINESRSLLEEFRSVWKGKVPPRIEDY